MLKRQRQWYIVDDVVDSGDQKIRQSRRGNINLRRIAKQQQEEEEELDSLIQSRLITIN